MSCITADDEPTFPASLTVMTVSINTLPPRPIPADTLRRQSQTSRHPFYLVTRWAPSTLSRWNMMYQIGSFRMGISTYRRRRDRCPNIGGGCGMRSTSENGYDGTWIDERWRLM